MFINVVIIRVILFCAGVPPSPSLVSRNATSFVSLLRKVPRPSSALLFLSFFTCVREKEKRERKRQFIPLTLRFFHPFLLSLSFSLSLIEQIPLVFVQLSPSFLPFLSLSLSIPSMPLLARCYRSRVSPRSHSFSSSPSAETFLPSGLPSRCFAFFPFGPLVLPRVVFHPSSRQSSPPGGHHRPHCASSSFSLVLFCPCRSLMF